MNLTTQWLKLFINRDIWTEKWIRGDMRRMLCENKGSRRDAPFGIGQLKVSYSGVWPVVDFCNKLHYALFQFLVIF